MRPPRVLLVAAAISVSQSAAAQSDQVILVRGATVHTAAGAPIPNGAVLVRAGRIAAVGANLAAPAGARIIEAAGKVVIPGMIDNHSHIGARPTDLNDTPMLIGPQHRFIDALDWNDPDFADAVSGGVTTIVTGPGSGENVSGMATVIKTFGTDYSTRMLLEKGGMKFAMGAKGRARYPATTMGVAANLRQYLIRTQEYVASRKKWEDDGRKGNPPARDLGFEAMSEVLEKRTYVRAHVHPGHRRDDARQAQGRIRLRSHASPFDRGVQGRAGAGEARHLGGRFAARAQDRRGRGRDGWPVHPVEGRSQDRHAHRRTGRRPEVAPALRRAGDAVRHSRRGGVQDGDAQRRPDRPRGRSRWQHRGRTRTPTW